MKKTFKKQIVILAVVTVMMILALVMPASAEDEFPCPGATGGGHLEVYKREIVIPPTCTQRGYSKIICDYCETVVYEAANFTEPTGHNYVVSYVDKGEHYERIRTCQNELCQRGGNDITDQNRPKVEIAYPNGIDEAKDTEGNVIKYYRAEYLNTFESPDRNAENHADSFLPYCYSPVSSVTWVLNCTHDEGDASSVYAPKVYTTGKKATVDNTVADPDYEFVDGTDGLMLYIQENKDAPEYTGETPKRGKNLTYGRYTFEGWNLVEVKDGKRIYHAEFTPDVNVTVSVAFYNYTGTKLTLDNSVPYGGTINYGELVAPARENDQYNEYHFKGWTFGNGGPVASETLTADITAYYSTGIYAEFEAAPRTYTVEFMVYDRVIDDAKASVAATVDEIKCGNSLRAGIAGIDPTRFAIDRDKKYIYEQNTKEWIIKKINGEDIVSKIIINPDNFDLPKSVLVKDKDSGLTKEIFFGKNETNTVTIAPTYKSQYVRYNFKVSIMPTHFLDEDVYPDNSIFKSEILDKFIIQVTDENGQFITAGTTDKTGVFWFEAPYRDTLLITASMSNRKYYGEHEIDLKSCRSAEDIERIVDNGIFIYPKVTQEWTDGLKSCNCICHSFLGGIVVRIYNLLYRLFNIKYVCCDDLFIVHGKVLIYTK